MKEVPFLSSCDPIRLSSQGERVLIFSSFTMCLDVLEDVLRDLGLRFLRIDGSTSMDER